MKESLLFSIATDKNSFVRHQRPLWKDTIAHKLHHDVKFMLQCYHPKNFEFFTIDNKMGFAVLAGEALCKLLIDNL